MNEIEQKRVPFLLWPVHALWRLLTFVLRATGRLVCALIGLILMVLGATISLSIIGAPLGIPLLLLGFLLLLRALF